MIVEIYELNQTEEEMEAESEERKELIRDLDLKEKQAQVVPFPEMSVSDQRVWHELLPFKARVNDYTGYIPTKVLRTFKAFKDDFRIIHIWSDRAGDPILVGEKDGNSFLLARWGEAIEPFESLREKAIRSWKDKRRASAEACLASVDNDALRHFSGEWVGGRIHE